jgi:uncharacterized membrane protein HdeD (DUF308 family)
VDVNVLRLGAAGIVLMTAYYARFFIAVRQEASTLAQIGLLLVAATILVLPSRLLPRLRANPWLIGLGALALAIAVFMWADRDSHSVSDTLTRAVPALSLILAVGARLTPGRSLARR